MNPSSDEPEKRFGRTMLYIGWLIALGILVYVFSGFEENRRNPNQNIQLGSENGSIELEKNVFGHYLFTGLANNQKVEFLLDTGATSIVFTEEQARKIGLQKGFPLRVNTANGEIDVYSTRLARLQMGDIVLQDLEAVINPHMDGEALLGMSALGELEWTQRGDILTIRQ